MARLRIPSIPSTEITPEPVYLGRRHFMQLGSAAILGSLMPTARSNPDPLANLAPLSSHPGPFGTAEPATDAAAVTGYNNFYEFGTSKSDPAENAHSLRTHPWSVAVTGACAKPATYTLEDLLRGQSLEERVYRLVHGHSMDRFSTGSSVAPFRAYRQCQICDVHDPERS